MKVRIRRIPPLQFAACLGVIYVIWTLLFMLILTVFLKARWPYVSVLMSQGLAENALKAIIGGGAFGYILAVLYNVIAQVSGGLVIHVEEVRTEQPKVLQESSPQKEGRWLQD